MQSTNQAVVPSKKLLWTGRIISALPVLLLLFSGVMKLMKPLPVLEGFARYGYSEHLILTIAFLEIVCTIVYVIPQTSVLGAILLTGYLGGATATNLRVGDPSFTMTVVLGVLVWTGLFLRDERLRALILSPSKSSPIIQIAIGNEAVLAMKA